MNELNKQNMKNMSIMGLIVIIIMVIIGIIEYLCNGKLIYICSFIFLGIFCFIIFIRRNTNYYKYLSCQSIINYFGILFIFDYLRVKIVGLSISSFLITTILGVIIAAIFVPSVQKKNKDVEKKKNGDFLKKWPFIVGSLSLVVARNIHVSDSQYLIIMRIVFDFARVFLCFLAFCFPITLIYVKKNHIKL